MNARQKLKQIVENAQGDDLERAMIAFSGLKDEQLDKPHGQSGVTHRQVLKQYQDERENYKAAQKLLRDLLSK